MAGDNTVGTDEPRWPQVVVILGAGFSHAVFPDTPMTDQLGEAVRARLDDRWRVKVPPGKFTDGRFEEWLSYISEPQPHLTPEEIADTQALGLRVTRMLCEVLSGVQTAALATEPPEWFWQFLSVLHVLRAQVITLDYDNFIECGVHTLGLQSRGWEDASTVCEDDLLAGLPPCAEFPGVSVQSVAQRTWAGDPITADERRHNTFKLLKLHGSLSWYWLPDGSGNSTLRRWRLPGTFGELWDAEEEHRRQVLPAHEVFIVPPAALKGQRLREPVTKELWRRAAEALGRADRVVLIGYSVPLADHSITGMLSDNLLGRDVQIEIVNPSPSVVEGRLVRLGIPFGSIDQISGEDCIARWTTTEVERLAIEALRALRRNSVLTGEELMFAAGPRIDRFNRFELPGNPSDPITLHVNPIGQQLTKPLQYKDIRDALSSAAGCAIETDGIVLPVIDHWIRPEGAGGGLMAQLHLVAARRTGRTDDRGPLAPTLEILNE